MKTLYIIYILLIIGSLNPLFAQNEQDSLFKFKDLKFETISQYEFEKYELDYARKIKNASIIDTNGYIKSLDLIVIGDCKEICETYLEESKSGKKMLLPSNFDAGILGLLFSASGKQFIIFSSYDGPDYEEYYSYRAEIIAYKILPQEKGLNAIKTNFHYYSKDWSIEKIAWINENSIALKIFKEQKSGDGSKTKYEYYKTTIK